MSNTIPQNRAVLITGASTGIGKACALKLDQLGWRVFATTRRAEDADALRDQASSRLTPVLMDVTDAASIHAALATVTAAVGAPGLAGLVNNAGIAVAGPLEFLPLDELRRQWEVNVLGCMAVTQASLPLLRAGQGRIVHIGSVSGLLAFPMLGPYNASKFALEALNDALRMELRPWGIRVIMIEPSGIQTPIWDKGRQEADRLAAKLPPRAHELYGRMMDAARRIAEESGRDGKPVEVVVDKVVHALTARRPRTRYLVGMPRPLMMLVRALPDRLRDRVILSQLK